MNKGDLVKLKGCDQPVMVVRWVRESITNQAPKKIGIICEWFDKELRLQQHEFTPESLEEALSD